MEALTGVPSWLRDTKIVGGRCRRCGALVPVCGLEVAAWLLTHQHPDTADVLVRAWALRALTAPAAQTAHPRQPSDVAAVPTVPNEQILAVP